MSFPLQITQEFMVLAYIVHKNLLSYKCFTPAVPLFIHADPLSVLGDRGTYQGTESQIPNQEEGKVSLCP